MQNVNVVNVKQVEMVVPKQADDSTHDRPRSLLFVAARPVNIWAIADCDNISEFQA